MLPNIECEYRGKPLGERIFSITALRNEKRTLIIMRQPYPSRSKQLGSCILKLFLEFLETAKLFLDSFAEFAVRFSASIGREREEVKYVVPRLRGIVEERPLRLADYIFQSHIGPFCPFDKIIEIIYIGFLMLTVVIVYSFTADDRLEGLALVR